jgi:hypothetical protein
MTQNVPSMQQLQLTTCAEEKVTQSVSLFVASCILMYKTTSDVDGFGDQPVYLPFGSVQVPINSTHDQPLSGASLHDAELASCRFDRVSSQPCAETRVDQVSC